MVYLYLWNTYTCGQARWWGMTYGAAGVALHGTCAGRRAARVRGQS